MLLPIVVLASLTLGGYFLLVKASNALGANPEFLEINLPAALGLLTGTLASYTVWGRMRGESIRKALLPLAQAADRGFYVDYIYTLVASRMVGFLSSLSIKLQRGIPSVNTLWLMGLLLTILIIILGVV